MSIQFERGINEKELREVIKARIIHERADAVLFEAIFEVLKKFQGKQITKRIATAIAERLKTRAFLYKQYGLVYIDVERPEQLRERPPYGRDEIEKSHVKTAPSLRDPFMRIYLRGPKAQSGPIVHDITRGLDYDGSLESNAWGPLIRERADKLEKGLDELPDLVQLFNGGLEMIQEANEKAGQYGLEYYFDIATK